MGIRYKKYLPVLCDAKSVVTKAEPRAVVFLGRNSIILQRIYGIESFDYTVIHLHDSTLAAYNDYSSPFQPSVSIK